MHSPKQCNESQICTRAPSQTLAQYTYSNNAVQLDGGVGAGNTTWCCVQAKGQMPACGHLHPLLKVRTQFRKIFTQMGFTEMPTNNYVESSFWNFDALFQPQQHPARDAHDTFFLSEPAGTPVDSVPADYLQRVREVHENGGFGSVGCGLLCYLTLPAVT